MHSSHQMVEGDSFLLRGLGPDLRAHGPMSLPCTAYRSNWLERRTLANRGEMPEITEREISDDTRAIWIGGDLDQMLLFNPLRTAFRRSVTEAIGYALVKTWTNDIVLTMDDHGECAELLAGALALSGAFAGAD